MARRSPVRLGLALALVFVITIAQAEDKCRTGCRHGDKTATFKYQDGTTYKYNFDSKIEISLSSAEGQKSTTQVKAQVLLTQQAQCNQILRIQNVQVYDNEDKKHTGIPDLDKPIRLNFHDGHLEDSICVVPGDTQNSINIKRAIASIFQANLKSGHETDVFGLCPTEVSHHKEGNLLTVQKSRNLNRCAYRESIKQDFLATAFNLNSEIKSSPLLNADYEAKLRIKNGILDQATVTEQYLYLPFSVGNKGAKASAETTLKFTGTSKDNVQSKVSQPRSVIFEDPHPVNSPHTTAATILQAVKETAKTIDVTVGEHTAKEFINLVKILKVSNKDALLSAYNQVRAGVGFADKTTAKKLFLDALLRSGHGDTIEVAIELLKNNELNAIEQKLVYFGLSLVRHTSESALNAAAALLEQPNLPREAYLGIGTLAGRYCRQHSCQNVNAINTLTQKLIQKLGNGKPTNKQQETDIIFVLKALANVKHLNDAILPKIVAIAQDKKTSNRVRVAALEVYASDPCKDKLRDSALTILKDIQQDAEIRIKAYLALAQCPNTRVGNAVKTLLDSEPSYQVGGFIVSHIRNLRSSANPDKEHVKQHLGFINVPKRFPVDLRKYSANGEFSYSIDSLGLATAVESNIIYSQNSFVPRSSSFNLSAEIFGHSFNFLELEVRQENFDRLIEHYLGPKGLLRANSLQDLWDSKGKYAKNILDSLKERVEKSLRSRRDLSKAELDHINKQVQIKTNELNLDLDLDFSVKAFGSEVVFLNVHDDAKFTWEALVDKIVQGLNEGLDHVKHFDETVRSNLLFLDAELGYPTSSGFPIRLGVEGSSNVQLKAAGGIDLKALFQGADTTVKISLIPSANIEIAGRLTIDTWLVESGLKVISTLHTATGGDLKIDNFAGGIDIKFALPVEKQNLISASHDVVFHKRELGNAEVNKPLKFAQNKDFSICLDQLSPLIGLTFCGEITGPNLSGKQVPVLPFPLAGDAKLAVTIEREDVSQYHYRQVSYNTNNKFGMEINLETLGNNNQRKVSLDIEAFAMPEKVIKATLTSPIVTASAEGRITLTAHEQSISLRLLYDTNEYFAKLGVGIEGSPNRAIYKPILQYKTPQDSSLQIPPYRVEGQVIHEQNGPQTKFIFDNVRLIIPDKKTITINGNIGQAPETFFADLTLSDGSNTGSLKGQLQVNANQIKYNAEVKNSLSPDGNVHLKGEVSKQPNGLKHYFQLIHGRDLASKVNILTIENSGKYRNKGPEDFVIETKNKITYPLVGLGVQFDFELKPKALDYDFNVQYGDIKVGSELEWEYLKKPEGVEYELEFQIWGLNNLVELKSKRKLIGDQSQIENFIEVNGKKIEVNGKVKHHIKPHDLDVGADLVVKVPTHNVPFKLLFGLKLNANEIDISEKISSGSTVYCDVFLKANRAGNANGAIKMNLKGELTVNGQIKANKGSGSGDLTIELPGAKRSAKADTTFTIHDPTYNIEVHIYPMFSHDKTKKITLSTHSKISQEVVDSKNTIDFFGNKLDINAKANIQGDYDNGKQNGELEIILPSQQYFAGKLAHDRKTVNNVANGNLLLSSEYRTNKNTPGAKITVTGLLTNSNFQDNIYNVLWKGSAEDGKGKHLNVDLGLKRQPQGDSTHSEITNKIYGSILSQPLETIIKVTCKNLVGSYEGRSTYGPQGTIAVKGTYDVEGASRPVTGDFNLDLTSNSQVLRSVKLTVGGSVLKGDKLEVSGNGKIYADAPDGVVIDWSGNGEVKASDKDGRVKGTIKSGTVEPISIDTGFSRQQNKENVEIQGDVAVGYGKNQRIKGDVTVTQLPNHEYKLDGKLETPAEKFRNNRLQVHTKRNEDNSRHQGDLTLTSDGQKWTYNHDLVLSELAPSISIQSKAPDGKLAQFYGKINKISNSQLGAEVKIINQHKNFVLEGGMDANVENIDNFHIKITAHCPAFKLDKIVLEAQNKPAKAGRRIQVTIKSANKNILQGSTSYTTSEEKGKLIVEGSGSFKVKEETQSANFKYIRQNLSQDKNRETGIEITFDAGLGNKAIDAEFKITNKQFRILNSYCEEKKQCAHVEIDAKTNSDELAHFNQEIEITVDLRKLGLPHEFGLKAVTTRKDYLLDHTVDVHFQSQDNNKYQYSLYIHPKEAGVSLTTPKRIIAIEANINAPPTIMKEGGKIVGEIVLYIDKKNQPNQKSALIGWLNINPQGYTVDGEVKFTNPAISKPLRIYLNSKVVPSGEVAITTTITLDIFAQENQKILITINQQQSDLKNLQEYKAARTVTVTSTGLAINIRTEELFSVSRATSTAKAVYNVEYQLGNSRYNSAWKVLVSPQNLNILVRALNLDLLTIDSKLQLTDSLQIADTEIGSYGIRPKVSHLEIINFNTLKLTIAPEAAPNDKLQVNAGLIPGQIADFRAEIVKGGAKHELAHATIKLDDANFLKSDYAVQSDNIQQLFLTPFKAEIAKHVEELKKVSDEWSKSGAQEVRQWGELAKRATPNLGPLKNYYVNELVKIKEEIASDKTIRDLSEFLHNLIAALSQAFGETFANFSQLVENVVQTIQTSFSKVLQVIEKELLPRLKETIDKLLHVAGEIINTTTDIVLTYLAKLSQIAEQFQPELKQLGALFGEVSQDIARVVANTYDSIRVILTEQFRRIYIEIKALPLFEQIKTEYQNFINNGLPTRETVANTISDFISTLKDLAPTDELKELLEAISQFIQLKLTNSQADDGAAIKRIIKTASTLIERIAKLLAGEEGGPDFQGVQLPLSVNLLNKLPRLAAVRFSPIAYILREDIPGVSTFILSLVNTPRNLIPPFPLYGVIAQGQHIFTFDGKHLTFPGKCNYLLARDALDGNFTVVGTYENGILTAISLAEGADVITLKQGGQVLLNHSPVELPIRKPNIAAYRDYEKIELVSRAGIKVACGPQLVVCLVTASGFYHGKLRGLLGNGNNEPYDDFTQGNGKIVSADSDFANSYKLANGCPTVQALAHEHHHHPSPTCDKLFGWESELRLCYPFVSNENFKEACSHGVASGVKDTEFAIAIAYVAACKAHNIPVAVPAQFVKCANGDQPIDLGDKFSVKTPGKSADIVLLVDTVKKNEPVYKEYVQPLVQQLTQELNSKGISDVEFHLITYGGDNQWPSHVTVNGGKLTFKGKAPNLKFSETPKPHHQLITGCKLTDGFINLLRELGHDIELAFGQDLQAQTYNEGIQYPFRANSIKSIIAVTGNACQVGRFYNLQVLRTLLYRGKNINLNLITPFDSLTVRDAKHTKEVVGFNAETVFTVAKGKGKGGSGAELHKDLEYSDYCVDFTVQNNGNVFVLDNFLQAKGAARKQFVQITSHNIVDQFVNTEQGLDCECKLVSAYTARNVCKVVTSKERAVAKKAGVKS